MFRYPISVGDAHRENFVEVSAWVDTGALYSQFPSAFLEGQGHRSNEMRRFRLADGSSFDSPVGDVPLRLNGVTHTLLCVFGEGEEMLLGATTLETFGLAVDPVNETLVPTTVLMLTMLPADDVT